jgi:hypothetical protein
MKNQKKTNQNNIDKKKKPRKKNGKIDKPTPSKTKQEKFSAGFETKNNVAQNKSRDQKNENGKKNDSNGLCDKISFRPHGNTPAFYFLEDFFGYFVLF